MTTELVYLSTNDLEASNDFTTGQMTFYIKRPFNASKIMFDQMIFSNTEFTINSKNNKLYSSINSGSTMEINVIPEGYYTITSLLPAIQTVLTTQYPSVIFTVSQNPLTKMITISTNLVDEFVIYFEKSRLYKTLGFRQKTYSGSNEYTGVLVPSLYSQLMTLEVSFITNVAHGLRETRKITALMPLLSSVNGGAYYQNLNKKFIPVSRSSHSEFTVSLRDDNGDFVLLKDHITILMEIQK